MLLIVPQSGTEQVLQARVDDLGVQVVRGAEVVGLTQDDDGVTVRLRRRHVDRARATSSAATVRTAPCGSLVGIEFAGKQYETHILLADVQLTQRAGGRR